MEVGDTVRIKLSDAVGIIIKIHHDFVFGPYEGRHVVRLAKTMKEHIFQEKDIEVIN